MASPHRIWGPTMNAGNAFSSQLYASNGLAGLDLNRLIVFEPAMHERSAARAGLRIGPSRSLLVAGGYDRIARRPQRRGL